MPIFLLALISVLLNIAITSARNQPWQPPDTRLTLTTDDNAESRAIELSSPQTSKGAHLMAAAEPGLDPSRACTAKPDLLHLSELLRGANNDSEVFLDSASTYLWSLLEYPLRRGCAYISLTGPLAKFNLPDNFQVCMPAGQQIKRCCTHVSCYCQVGSLASLMGPLSLQLAQRVHQAHNCTKSCARPSQLSSVPAAGACATHSQRRPTQSNPLHV